MLFVLSPLMIFELELWGSQLRKQRWDLTDLYLTRLVSRAGRVKRHFFEVLRLVRCLASWKASQRLRLHLLVSFDRFHITSPPPTSHNSSFKLCQTQTFKAPASQLDIPVMPRKSTGGAASTSASTPSTPTTKSAPRKSLNPEDESSATSSSLTLEPSTKLVLKQQETALKSSGIENYELPRAQVIKVAKSDIPDSVQLRKEVQQALVKSASVFISYLTAAAHDRATGKGGKIISANHVLEAWKELEIGGEDEVRVLKEQLGEYRRAVVRKEASKQKVKEGEEEEGDADVSRAAAGGEEEDEEVEEGDETRAEVDGGDASMLKRSLQNGSRHADDDEEEEEDEGEDQLMDED